MEQGNGNTTETQIRVQSRRILDLADRFPSSTFLGIDIGQHKASLSSNFEAQQKQSLSLHGIRLPTRSFRFTTYVQGSLTMTTPWTWYTRVLSLWAYAICTLSRQSILTKNVQLPAYNVLISESARVLRIQGLFATCEWARSIVMVDGRLAAVCAPRASAFLQMLRDALSDTRGIESNASDIPARNLAVPLFPRRESDIHLCADWDVDSRFPATSHRQRISRDSHYIRQLYVDVLGTRCSSPRSPRSLSRVFT